MAEVHRARAACLVVSLLVVCGPPIAVGQSVLAADVTVAPAYDVEASSTNGTNFVLSNGGWDVNTQQLPSYNVYRRGVMEFSLASVPTNWQTGSASLRLYVNVMTSDSTPSYPRLSVYGFAGDGVSDVADATRTATLIGQSAPITSLGTINISLDKAFVDAVRASSGYPGLVMFDPTSGHQAGFYTTEASAINAVTPQLKLTSVPEPISLASLALGLGIAAYRRRR